MVGLLCGKRISLKPMQITDASRVVKWRNKQRVRNSLFGDKKLSLLEHKRWYSRIDKKVDKPFMIQVGEFKPIGTIRLYHIDYRNKNAEIGNLIIGEKRDLRKGYAYESTMLLVKYAFEKLNMNRLYLHVLTRNKLAINFYRKCGFKKEGVLREAIFKNHKFEDVLLMSVIKKKLTKI